jgi:hypothetical protein
MKTLHLKAVDGRIVTVDPEQQVLFTMLTGNIDNLFIETFREGTIPFFNKHEIDYTIYREVHFPHVLNDVRRCLDDFKNGRYVTNFEFINDLEKIINNKEI